MFAIAELKKPNKNKPLIFFCDGHSTRFNADKLEECINRHIIIFIGVPNGTHLYQTLDDQIFKQFQNMRYKLIEYFKKHYKIKYRMHHAAHIGAKALRIVMKDTDKYIKSAAKNCGLLPWNPDAVKPKYAKVIGIDVGDNVHAKKKIPSRKPGVQSFLLEYGGVITSKKVIEYLRAGDEWKTLWKEYMVEQIAVADVEEQVFVADHLFDEF